MGRMEGCRDGARGSPGACPSVPSVAHTSPKPTRPTLPKKLSHVTSSWRLIHYPPSATEGASPLGDLGPGRAEQATAKARVRTGFRRELCSCHRENPELGSGHTGEFPPQVSELRGKSWAQLALVVPFLQRSGRALQPGPSAAGAGGTLAVVTEESSWMPRRSQARSPGQGGLGLLVPAALGRGASRLRGQGWYGPHPRRKALGLDMSEPPS